MDLPNAVFFALAIASSNTSLSATSEAQIRSLHLAVGETTSMLYPAGTDLTLSHRGIVEAFPGADGRWQLTALRKGFVVVDARDSQSGESRWPRLMIQVEVPPLPAAPRSEGRIPAWLCVLPEVTCDQGAGLVEGQVASFERYRQARSDCGQSSGCRFALRLSTAGGAAWASELRRRLPALFEVHTPPDGPPQIQAYCGRDGRGRLEDQLATRLDLSSAEVGQLLRCREDDGEPRFLLRVHVDQIEEVAAQELGFEAGVDLTLTAAPPARAGAGPNTGLFAKLHAMEINRQVKTLGEPVLRVPAYDPVEFTSGGEFEVEGEFVTTPRRSDIETVTSWKDYGLTIKAQVAPLSEARARVVFDLSLKSRDQGQSRTLSVNHLHSELPVTLGQPVMAAILDLRSNGTDDAALPWLSRIPIIAPLAANHGQQHAKSRLVLWFEVDQDSAEPELPKAWAKAVP